MSMQELIIDAKTENLHQVFDFVLEQMRALGCDDSSIFQCKLCVEEIFLNIASYAYAPEVGPAKVTMSVEGSPPTIKIIFTFSDNGKPFNPLSNETPDVDASLDDRPIGGLGIFLVTTTMDNVTYDFKNGQNVLTFEKTLTVPSNEA